MVLKYILPSFITTYTSAYFICHSIHAIITELLELLTYLRFQDFTWTTALYNKYRCTRIWSKDKSIKLHMRSYSYIPTIPLHHKLGEISLIRVVFFFSPSVNTRCQISTNPGVFFIGKYSHSPISSVGDQMVRPKLSKQSFFLCLLSVILEISSNH